MKKVILSLLIIFCTSQLFSQLGGTLDPSFANAGKLILSINPGSDKAYGIAQLSNGSFLVAGSTYSSIYGNDFFCIKVDSNGALVSSFGNGGKITTDVQLGSQDVAYSIALDDATGKFILAGTSDNGTKQSAALVRYNANGQIDSTFGVNGKVLTNFTAPNANKEEIRKIRIHYLTGKIIAAGRTIITTTSQLPVVARYNSNGSIDTSFNHTGIVVPNNYTNRQYELRDVTVNSAGIITAVGGSYYYRSGGATGYGGFATRINSNGNLDPSFDNDGKLECYYMTDNNAMYIDPTTDYIYNAGDLTGIFYAQSNVETRMAVKRIFPNGDEDNNWAGGSGNYSGHYTSINGFDASANALGVFSNGQFVMAGKAFSSNESALMMIKTGTDGYKDYTFAPNANYGNVEDQYGGTNAEIFDLVIQPNDEKIVVVGYVDNNLFVSRYFGITVPQLDSFHLIAPLNNTTNIITTDVDFQWSPALGATDYELWWDTTAAFGAGTNKNTYSDTTTNAKFYPLYIPINKTIYWKVRSTDGTNISSWKGPWQFTTSPDLITLISPSNHATNVARQPTLDWSDLVAGNFAVAELYQVQLDSLSDFSTPNNIFTQPFPTSNWALPSLIPYNTTIYWRVRTVRNGMFGPWSTTWDFKTLLPAGINDNLEGSENTFTVYPNPTSSDFILLQNGDAKILRVEAFDAVGKKIVLNAIGKNYDATELAVGIYRLKISTDKGFSILNFVKQ